MPGNFILNIETTPSTSNETSVLYIVNPPTNTNKLYKIKLIGTSLANGTTTTFRVYVNPTVSSNGTALTPVSRNFTDGNISLMNMYLSPTVISKGTHVSTFSVSASGSYLINTDDWYLLHGNSFLVTAQENPNNKTLAINISWSE